MKFTILRLLTHSELGMFHEYRRQGRERAKQRAINFDGDVVDRVFPAFRDQERIAIECRRLEGAGQVVQVSTWLKRQHKNWRFEGDCPTTPYYDYVEPSVLFAMVVDAGTTPAKASWVVIPTGHPARDAILNHGESARLGKSAMIALYDDEGHFCRSVLGRHYPNLFERVEAVTSTPFHAPSDEVAPDPAGTINILARAGHSLPSAVADLVDNSLSHKASVIDITFPEPNKGGRWMCICDDGEGMTPDGLRQAMRVGSRRAYDAADLGKFGYGLKGAAWSQADRLTVVSKAAGHPLKTLIWDKDHLTKTGRWELLDEALGAPQGEFVSLGESGTAVVLTQMRPPAEAPKARGVEPYAQEVAAIRDHLELVFHRYLEGKVPGRDKVTIRLNGRPLRPNNPMGHPLTKAFDPRSIELGGNSDPTKKAILEVRAFITPNEAEFDEFHKDFSPEAKRDARERLTLNGRANDAQGLYFYRLNRLIKWGGWEDLFAKDEHTKLLRVAVDFDRESDDQLQVDISKQLIRLPVAVFDLLKEIIKGPRAEARNRYNNTVRTPPPKPAGATMGGPAVATTARVSGTAPVVGGSSVAPVGVGGSNNAALAPPPARKEKSPLSIVPTETAPWRRKTTFAGERVEIGLAVPELAELARAIEKDDVAGAALSKFLRVLEEVGAHTLLAGKPDGP